MTSTALPIDQAPACAGCGIGIGLVVVDSSRRRVHAVVGAGRPHPKRVAANIAFAARS